ncbi:D-allulose-6-phosphate 3-epimerase [Sebaldella termitidis]|uniref:Putative D-allulose-6-phosphate 3-epimerase n=1 Tax=Sebaldella termitidis (strain ATCC 33386 / NCTC 11300) TaxID=526218 RepID=D1ANT4_SEBTE|nr:D-allulose 6-phosphate 3-epimerase [Sebaldella termitidis]ACZ09888.1 Ribulose-phosphate 3-epimerase [Sebaldella termitidis ATCC 33386]SUI25220.1 D-allulose-6-phosphate 3-epimerase [Sebaldella termitidis]
MKKMMFSPSLMCMDLLSMKEQVEILNERADFYHVDIMDGHFVKNITLSPFFVSNLKRISKLPIDVHLMTEYPDDYIEELAKSGADYICPHAETINKDAFRIINKIKGFGCKAGIVLNPATPIEWIKYYIHLLDKITVMTVDPGFAGQPFIPEMLDKIKELKELKEKNGYNYLIEVDGSCNERTFDILTEAGAEVLIVGSSGLFNLDSDLPKAWDKMMEIYEAKTAK